MQSPVPARARIALVSLVVGMATASVLGCGEESAARGVALPFFRGGLAAWSPDSRSIAVPAKDGIELLRADGSRQRLIASPQPYDPLGERCAGKLAWSAGARRLNFTTRAGSEDRPGCWVGTVGVDGSGLERVPLDVPLAGVAWAPGGWPLVYIPGSRFFSPGAGPVGPTPDLWRLDSLHATPRRILAEKGEEALPAFSPNGDTVLYSRVIRGRSSVWTVGADGSRPRRVAGGLISLPEAAWSPDGKLIALTAFTRRGDRRAHVYVVDAIGGRLRQVTAEEVLTGPPAWTPDGRWITYSNYQGEIKRIHSDGTGAETVANLPGQEIRDLLWSPDGRHLSYAARPFPPAD